MASMTAATAPSAEPASGIHSGAEIRVGLQDRRRRAIGGIAVLVGRLAAHQLHLRIMLFHVGDQRRHAQVVVALSRVLQNRIFGAVADLLDDLLGGKLGLGQVVGGDVGGSLGLRRIRREGDDVDPALDCTVDGFDERVRLHGMQQDARRLLHQVLFKGRDLLGDVVVRRAREDRLAAHGLGRLLEALVYRNPVGMSGDHDIHDVGLARFTLELALGRRLACCRERRSNYRRGDRPGKS